MVPKVFVISVVDIPTSLAMAEAAVASAGSLGYEAEVFPAHTPDTAAAYFEERGLGWMKVDTQVPGLDREIRVHTLLRGTSPGALGCLASHWDLWELAASMDDPIIIFEHDSVMTRRWDESLNEQIADFLMLHPEGSSQHYPARIKGIPEFEPGLQRYRVHDVCVYGGRDKSLIVPGAHAYMITPQGASKLIADGHATGLKPADRIIREPVLKLEVYQPGFAELQDTLQPSLTCR